MHWPSQCWESRWRFQSGTPSLDPSSRTPKERFLKGFKKFLFSFPNFVGGAASGQHLFPSIEVDRQPAGARLVNVAGFNSSLNWTNSREWLNVFTNAGHLFIHVSEQRNAQGKKRVHETSLDQENTRLYWNEQRGTSTIDFASSQQGD
jgi:hypothetical protein